MRPGHTGTEGLSTDIKCLEKFDKIKNHYQHNIG